MLKKLTLFFVALTYSMILVQAQNPDQVLIKQGKITFREIPPGRGQNYAQDFLFYTDFHFIQFGVFPDNVDKTRLRAPKGVGRVWVIHHKDTRVLRHEGEEGAYYIVKPYSSEEEARKQVNLFKARQIDCWFNEKLSSVRFTVVGFSPYP